MGYFDEVYNKRLNRYGNSMAERIQGQREADFAEYKKNSIYKVEFCDHEFYGVLEGVLEPNKQDETETTAWLLVDSHITLPNGAIFEIANGYFDNYWMVFYKKESQARGYNKYLMLKMTHLIQWYDRENEYHESWGYFFGKTTRIIYDVVRSTAKMPDYHDPNKEVHIIMPSTENLKRQDYLEIDGEGFYVTGSDKSSTPGVTYFSLKETMLREVNTPEKKVVVENNTVSEDTFWFEG